MRHKLPRDLVEAIYETIDDPVKRSDAITAIENHINRLCEQKRFEDRDEYVADERKQYQLLAANQNIMKRRAKLWSFSATFGPPLIAAAVQLAIYNPFS